jgi:hypothetical protein
MAVPMKKRRLMRYPTAAAPPAMGESLKMLMNQPLLLLLPKLTVTKSEIALKMLPPI